MKGDKHIKTPMKHIKLFEQYTSDLDEAVYSRISDVSPDKIRAMTIDEFFNLFQAAPDFEMAATYLNIFVNSSTNYTKDDLKTPSFVTGLGDIMRDRGWKGGEYDLYDPSELDAIKKDIQLQKDLADPKKSWDSRLEIESNRKRREAEIKAKNDPHWINLYGKNNVDNFIKDLDKRVGGLLNRIGIINHSDNIIDPIVKMFKPTAIMIANDGSLSDEQKSNKLWKVKTDIEELIGVNVPSNIYVKGTPKHSVTELKRMGCWDEKKSYSDNLRTAIQKDPSVWGRVYVPEGVKKEDTDLIRGIGLLARFGGI